jgi:hypothetical protein
MRDARTKGETALHRAAAFGEEGTVKMLLDAGARRETRDANGDTPLSWASWYLRQSSILHQLCFGEHRVNPVRGKKSGCSLVGMTILWVIKQTADPSASLGMTKGRVALPWRAVAGWHD